MSSSRNPTFSLNKSLYEEPLYYENQMQSLNEIVAEMKISIDKMLDMRAMCAELELELASQFNPTMKQKLRVCQDMSKDCEKAIPPKTPQK